MVLDLLSDSEAASPEELIPGLQASSVENTPQETGMQLFLKVLHSTSSGVFVFFFMSVGLKATAASFLECYDKRKQTSKRINVNMNILTFNFSSLCSLNATRRKLRPK